MAKILCIDTATENCSIGICEAGKLLALEETREKNSHAELISVFTEKLLQKTSLTYAMLDAVAVSKGPGSYTGLRIGVSFAKGLCYALQKPLIAYPTLQGMALGVAGQHPLQDNAILCPMIDARRMEAYYALFDHSGNFLQTETAIIGSENMFSEFHNRPFYYFGSGAEKFQPILKSENFHFIAGIETSVSSIGNLVEEKFQRAEFEDMAYFEPFYLKEFYTPGKRS